MDHHASLLVRRKLMYVVMGTLVISAMSGTMYNIILPEIADEFVLTYAQASWVSTSYMLTYAIGSVTYGKLADMYKLKNLLTVGLAILTFGSLIGLVSQAFWHVLVGRVLQAMGAAVVPAATKSPQLRTLAVLHIGIFLFFSFQFVNKTQTLSSRA